MATATETLHMILTADDRGGPVIRGAGQAVQQFGANAKKAGQQVQTLGSNAGVLSSSLGVVTQQLGAIGGPIGQLVSNTLGNLTGGISGMTIATGGVVGAMGLLFSAIGDARRESENFKRALAAGDLKVFQDEVTRLYESIGDRKPFSLAMGNWSDLFKSARAVLFNLDERLTAYKESLANLTAGKVAEITREFQRQRDAIGAGGFEKIELQFQKARDGLITMAQQGKISNDEMKAGIQGLMSVREASIEQLGRETRASNRTAEVNIVNMLLSAEIRLSEAKRSGDAARADAIARDVEALRTKLTLIDQEAAKERQRRQDAQASAREAENAKKNAEQSLGIAAPGTLKGIRFVMEELRIGGDLSEEWTGKLVGVSGAFTNLIGPSEDIKAEIERMPGILENANSGAQTMKESFAAAQTTAAGVTAQLAIMEATIARINAQGGVKVVQ